MAYQDENQKRTIFNDTNIADDREKDNSWKGLQPKNQIAYKIFKFCRLLGILFLFLCVAGFALTKVSIFKTIGATQLYRIAILGLGALGLFFLLIMLLVRVTLLRKCPFDDWVFEVAQRDLGTDVIFYTSKCLYIKYDIASAKEVDKRDFVTKMSDLSQNYSYFYVNTFVDQQVIQVECTKRQPIPTMAKFSPEDDLFWNIIPLGLTIHPVLQQVAPIGWYLNDQQKNEMLRETVPSTSILIAGGTGSGKSVMEQAIVGHVSRYDDRFMLVGVDCKRVEFNLLRGVKGVKGVALDVQTAADTVATFQQQMMNRFKMMENNQVNNIYKIKDKTVDYYEVFGRTYQFDEMFELTEDLDENDRNYSKLLMIYPTGRKPRIVSIEEIYKGLEEGTLRTPQLPEVKGYNSYIKKGDIKKTSGVFKPKAMLFLADELNELMNSDDYKSVDTVKQALGSIARLGRAAGVHLALACQRASGGTISSDLKNNIQMSCLLGGFDSGAGTLMFEKDISNLAKPEIKGRGFLQSGNEIIETQTYYTQPEDDWVFDEEQKLTYDNPVFIEQKNRKHEEIKDEGWVPQHKVDESPEDIKEEEIEEMVQDEGFDTEDLTKDLEEDFEDVWEDADTTSEEENDFNISELPQEILEPPQETQKIKFKFKKGN